jgi:hypothetical protein
VARISREAGKRVGRDSKRDTKKQALKFRETLWCVLRLKSIKYLIKALILISEGLSGISACTHGVM